MMLSSTLLAITVATAWLSFNPEYMPIVTALPACSDDTVALREEDANHTCDKSETIKIDEWHVQVPEKEIRLVEKPRYKIRDYDPCIPGLETRLGCSSNPDLPPCDDGSYPISRQVFDLEGNLVRDYIYCPGDAPQETLPDDQVVREIRITPDQFRSFPIRASKLGSDPNGFSLRNGHTHFWASKTQQEFNSNLSGADVKIKAIPIQWNWSYGDGTSRNLDFPGEPSPDHTLHDKTATSHLYTETGTFSVGVTTLYRGEFSVDGGPWQGIPGQAAVPSTPIQMDVWRTKKELIATD